MGRAVKFAPPDLSGILERTAKEYRWSPAAAKDAQKWYGRFLQLVWENPGGLNYIVSDNADRLWHMHITFTMRYRAYCEAILGFYLEHNPMLNAPPATAAEKRAANKAYSRWGGTIHHDMIIPCR